jgi:bifunctional DNA-binding transcriptional regulator/antitoxin component of YhaV-PrlF toxin-antitoxin module
MSEVEIKEIDEQGRIIIPKAWRTKRITGKKVVMRLRDGVIEILPSAMFDLTKFFDKIEADVRSDLADWHALRRELRKI